MGISAPWRRSRDLGGDAAIDPGRDPRAALELRVHGVHGTSPSSMLGVKDPRQVAGDGITGVFRAEKGLPRRVLRPEHAVEAYSWGALTSAVRGAFGWVQRVLWLGLLPFALINLAYWARLHVGVDDRRGRWGAAAVRWAALLLTMLYVLAASFLSLDLVAWQCYRGGTKSCDVLPGLLDFMMFLAPSQRLAVAAVVPLAGVGLMWFLSRHTLTRYEACLDSHRMTGGQHLLQDKRFWSSTRRTVRLQRIHLAAAFATLATYVGAQVDRLAERPTAWTLAAIAILVVCFAAAARLHPQDLEVPRAGVDANGPHDRWAVWLLGLSVVVVLTQMLWLFLGAADASRGWDSTLGWFGHNLWFIGVFVLLSAVNIAVFVAGRLSAFPSTLTIVLFIAGVGIAAWMSLGGSRETSRTDVWLILAVSGAFAAAFYVTMLVWQLRQGRPEQGRRADAWNGAGAAVLIGAAGWIALLFVTAAVTAASDYLNGPDQSVSDLTSYQPAVKESVTPKEVAEAEPDLVFSLAKGAVLRDGILVAGETPEIVRGSVMVATAEITDGGLRRTLPDTVVLDGVLRMEDTELLLVDTCLVGAGGNVPASCHPETPGFVSGAEVTVSGQVLALGADGRVRLEVAEPPNTPLVVPQVLIWAPIVQVVWALLAALIAIACAVRLKRRVGPEVAVLVERQQVPTESRVDVTSKRLRAAYAHRAERLIELLGAVTVGAVLVLLCLSATGLPPNALVSTLFPEWRSDLPHLVASLSLYVVLALSAGLVLLSSYVRRSEATRKAVGILWDLTTFWPRAAHPLSPPCYAERVVPEMTTRIRWGLGRGGLVVVSGHSQGSLIAVATLIRLDEEELSHIRFVTYGSQLRALYGRIFPSVLGPAVLGGAPTDGTPTFGDPHPDVPAERVAQVRPPGLARPTLFDLLGTGGWVNLFRRADSLGWRVFSDDDSDHDVCTPEVPPRAAGDPGPTVSTHSGYQHTIEYRRVVGGWLAEPLVEESDWSIGEVMPLPEP